MGVHYTAGWEKIGNAATAQSFTNREFQPAADERQRLGFLAANLGRVASMIG